MAGYADLAVAASAWADELEGTSSDGVGPDPVSTTGNKFYLKMQKVAAKLLKRFYTGAVTLHTTTETETGDPLKPFIITSSQKIRNAYVGGYSEDRIAKSNGLIQASDRRVIVDSTGLKNYIKNLQWLTIDGVTHTIVQVRPVPAAGICSVYIVQVRTADT